MIAWLKWFLGTIPIKYWIVLLTFICIYPLGWLVFWAAASISPVNSFGVSIIGLCWFTFAIWASVESKRDWEYHSNSLKKWWSTRPGVDSHDSSE